MKNSEFSRSTQSRGLSPHPVPKNRRTGRKTALLAVLGAGLIALFAASLLFGQVVTGPKDMLTIWNRDCRCYRYAFLPEGWSVVPSTAVGAPDWAYQMVAAPGTSGTHQAIPITVETTDIPCNAPAVMQLSKDDVASVCFNATSIDGKPRYVWFTLPYVVIQ